MRFLWLSCLSIVLGACSSDPKDETEADCGEQERLVADICLKYGATDGCEESADRCVRLCFDDEWNCYGTPPGGLCGGAFVTPSAACVVPESGFIVDDDVSDNCESTEHFVADLCLHPSSSDTCYVSADRCLRPCTTEDAACADAEPNVPCLAASNPNGLDYCYPEG